MVQELKKVAQTFGNNSTIHTVSFIADKNRDKSTRIFWTVALSFSIGFFGFYAYGAYSKWQINPDFLTRTHQRHISEIPVPSITICSPLFARDHLASISTFYNNHLIPKKFAENMTSEEANYLLANLQASSNPHITSQVLRLVPNRTETNIVKLLNKSFLKTKEFLFGCLHIVSRQKCAHVFNRVLTDRGFCYSSNMEGFNTIFRNTTISKDFHSYKRTKILKSPLPKHRLHNETINDDEVNTKWTLDKGFEPNHDPDEVPVAPERGADYKVVMFLNKSDANNLNVGASDLFNYQLHVPTEILTSLGHWEHVKFNYRAAVLLTAKIYRTNEDLRIYSPDTRGCYFDDERYLKYFKTYTKHHCEFECLANYTLDLCKCVKFSMPRDDDTPVCNETQTKCYFNFMLEFPKYDPVTKKLTSCNCLKSCTEIKYQIVSTQNVKMDSEQFYSYTKKNAYEGDVFSALTIRFSDHLIEEIEMYASYTLQNFIADTGGLLGLFMGCSLLSIIEVFFFLSQIIVQSMIYLWIKIQHRNNKVQNIISVKPTKTEPKSNLQKMYHQENIQRRPNDENSNESEQKLEKMQPNMNDFKRLEQKLNQQTILINSLEQQLQKVQANLDQQNKNISANTNQIEKLIRSQKF